MKQKADPTPARTTLAHRGARILHGISKAEEGARCRVAAYKAGTTQAQPGARLRFRVLAGDLALRPADGVVVADERGQASVTVLFKSVTAGIVEASVAGQPAGAIAFEARSEGVTDSVELLADATAPAAKGELLFTAMLRDHRGAAVEKAKAYVTARLAPDLVVEGTFKRSGKGQLQCRVKTRQAGRWSLEVSDTATRAVGRTVCVMTPDRPRKIELFGDLDPRSYSPRGRLELHAGVLDRFGNLLDPRSLGAKAEGKTLERTFRGGEAVFELSLKGHGERRVVLKDAASGLTRSVRVPFAAACLTDPGFVALERRFTTRVLLFPNKGITNAQVMIRFDPNKAKFVGFTQAPGGWMVAAKTEGRVVTLSIESRRPVVSEGSDGITVGEITWLCCGEGETWFGVQARMSPLTAEWDKCVLQKVFADKCFCVNIIHQTGDSAAEAAGQTAAEEIEDVISSMGNLSRCCPNLEPKIHFTTISLADWSSRVVAAVGADGRVSSEAEHRALIATGLGRKPRCINIYMIAHNDPGAGGRGSSTGDIALDPSLPGSRPNVGAHEVGHALGLPDKYTNPPGGAGPVADPGTGGNIMSWPHGENLTAADCRAIWARVADYEC